MWESLAALAARRTDRHTPSGRDVLSERQLAHSEGVVGATLVEHLAAERAMACAATSRGATAICMPIAKHADVWAKLAAALAATIDRLSVSPQ